MESAFNVLTVGHVIELAVAPVFLLTGIGAILSVLTNRLGRSVDRFRILNELGEQQLPAHRDEMHILIHRVRLSHWAISLCTTSALLISLVIVTLFLGSFAKVNVSMVITFLFVAAMTTLVIGLLSFLREIFLAARAIRLQDEKPTH
jgi:hypothetical protein